MQLNHSEAESEWQEALRGLPLDVLSRIISNCCSDGTMTVYGAEDMARPIDSSFRAIDNTRQVIWEHTILGVPLELHFYCRSPERIALKRKGQWTLAFSVTNFGVPERKFTRLSVTNWMSPMDLDGRPNSGQKTFNAFSFKRKGNKTAYKKDFSVLRLMF